MLSRRTLLLDGLRIAAVLPVLPTLAPLGRRVGEGRVLVVIQLTGGNDGLNTVIPWRQDAYYRARPTLALAASQLHALDDEHGFHPALGPLKRLFAEGRLTVVQGLGYPGASRSHFRSLETWHRARIERSAAAADGSGWLGRLAEQLAARAPGGIPAVHVGSESPSPALNGRHSAPLGIDSTEDLLLRAPREVEVQHLAPGDARDEAPDLAYLRATARAAHATARRLAHLDVTRGRDRYPEGELARKLHLVARLIVGGPETRLFSLALGGFDTHARQAGRHAGLLEPLARALAAFEEDLQREGVAERVTTLVFSEFGRRAFENGSRGTDHGAAAPILLVGGPGRGGLRGVAPDLDRLEDGDVPHGVDFRTVYTALERDWVGLEPSTDLPAFDFEA